MDDAIAIQQIETKPFGFTPLVAPPRPASAVAGLARATSPSTLRTRRDIPAIHAQHQHRAAKAPCRHLRHTLVNLGTRGCHIPYTEALGYLTRYGVQALTTYC